MATIPMNIKKSGGGGGGTLSYSLAGYHKNYWNDSERQHTIITGLTVSDDDIYVMTIYSLFADSAGSIVYTGSDMHIVDSTLPTNSSWQYIQFYTIPSTGTIGCSWLMDATSSGYFFFVIEHIQKS